MKNKWGIGIAIFYSSFVAVMIFFVFFSKTQNIDLVRDDYYNEDLRYQQKYEKLENTKNLKNDIVIDYLKDQSIVEFTFPAEMNDFAGLIQFYKPDNKEDDFVIPIHMKGEHIIKVPVGDKPSGVWRLNIDWIGDGTQYFKKHKFSL